MYHCLSIPVKSLCTSYYDPHSAVYSICWSPLARQIGRHASPIWFAYICDLCQKFLDRVLALWRLSALQWNCCSCPTSTSTEQAVRTLQTVEKHDNLHVLWCLSCPCHITASAMWYKGANLVIPLQLCCCCILDVSRRRVSKNGICIAKLSNS